MTTMAAIDRVVHHSVILDMMHVESYRAEAANHQHLHLAQTELLAKQTTPEAPATIKLADEELSASLIVADSTI